MKHSFTSSDETMSERFLQPALTVQGELREFLSQLFSLHMEFCCAVVYMTGDDTFTSARLNYSVGMESFHSNGREKISLRAEDGV